MKRSRFFKNLLFLISLTAALFVLLEIGLAIFSPHKVTTRQYHGQYHPVIGWINKPMAEGRVYITKNKFFYRTHNGKGLRSTWETDYSTIPGIKRVLLLGDSFFWGFGVDDKDVISESLQKLAGHGFEIINGAATGYGTDQELLWLAEEGLKYRPDLVVLGFFPTNDLDEISNSIMYGYPKPYFFLDNEKLIVRNIPVPDTRETRRKAFEEPDSRFGRLKRFLRYNSHAYQFITGRMNSIPLLRSLFLKTGIAEEFTTELPGIPRFALNPDMLQDLSDALILEIASISEKAGADFLLLFIPQKEQYEGMPSAYKGLKGDEADWNTRVSHYLKGFTSENRINFLDFLPTVRMHQARDVHLYNPDKHDHHWTPLGHRAAAEAIYEWLKENGWTGGAGQ
jgi:lysophospholipase L1-like esterase